LMKDKTYTNGKKKKKKKNSLVIKCTYTLANIFTFLEVFIITN